MNTFFLWAWITIEITLVSIWIVQLRTAFQRYRWRNDKISQLSLQDTPTISVCIPARNETHALTDCLTAVLASDYPKLEVIVLDDCSQDNTSQLIRSFANSGVRFIEGETPPAGWLGRNHALEVLSKNASGKYLLFMGVDTRVEPGTITQLANYMFAKRASMVCVLPQRSRNISVGILFSTLRYFWQLLLPQFLHTPAAASLWLIRATALEEAGGFGPLQAKVSPENALAQRFAAKNTYRFLLSDTELGAYYSKRWSSQVDTAIRLYYPALHKNPVIVLLSMCGLTLAYIAPFIAVVYQTLSGGVSLATVMLAIVCGGFGALYALFVRTAYGQPWLFAFISFPLVMVQEIVLLAASMFGYVTGRVNWKGRNICYPVLRRKA